MIRRRPSKPKPRPMKSRRDLVVSYKDPGILGRFLTDQGSIISREESGLTQKQQRRLSREIKRARHLAMLPFTQTL